MQKTTRYLALVGAFIAPLALAAQGSRMVGEPGGPGGVDAARATPNASVTRILNARRQLDLTPRQVTQLDSIERALFAERQAAGARMRTLRDSVARQSRARVERGERAMGEARRDSVRARMQSLRPELDRLRGRDSTARAAAQRVLTDPQRQRLREMQAEERGRQRGLREGRAGQRRDGVRGPSRGQMRGPVRGQTRGRMRD